MTLAMLVGVLGVYSADGRYLDVATFQAWHTLVPEAPALRLCGLTGAGHALWAQGGLRMPLGPWSVAVGALTSDQEFWAVLLEVDPEPSRCDGLLVLTRREGTWQRLAWQRLVLGPGEAPTALIWDRGQGALLIDTGERRRLTGAATLRWEDGRIVEATPGFVTELRLVRHVLWWHVEDRRFEYEPRAMPLEIPEPAEAAR